MQTIQHGDYNIRFWYNGANNEWYEYQLQTLDSYNRIVIDKIVRVVANDTARDYIDSKDFAAYVASNLRPGSCVRLVPTAPFRVQNV